MRIIKVHKKSGRASVYEDQCYSDTRSRYVKKFCIWKNLGGFLKKFGFAYILQIIDYDDYQPRWKDTHFLQRCMEDGEEKWNSLYNHRDKVRMAPKIKENGYTDKVKFP